MTKSEPRIFHYTIAELYNLIQQDQLIKRPPSTCRHRHTMCMALRVPFGREHQDQREFPFGHR